MSLFLNTECFPRHTDNHLRYPITTLFNENDVLWESAIAVRKKNSQTKDKPHGPSRHIKSPNVEMDLHSQAVLRCTAQPVLISLRNQNQQVRYKAAVGSLTPGFLATLIILLHSGTIQLYLFKWRFGFSSMKVLVQRGKLLRGSCSNSKTARARARAEKTWHID